MLIEIDSLSQRGSMTPTMPLLPLYIWLDWVWLLYGNDNPFGLFYDIDTFHYEYQDYMNIASPKDYADADPSVSLPRLHGRMTKTGNDTETIEFPSIGFNGERSSQGL